MLIRDRYGRETNVHDRRGDSEGERAAKETNELRVCAIPQSVLPRKSVKGQARYSRYVQRSLRTCPAAARLPAPQWWLSGASVTRHNRS